MVKTIAVQCQSCGNNFDAIPAEVARGRAKWCSRVCYFRRKESSLSARFWSKVRKTKTCWLWTGATYPAGYGCIGTPTFAVAMMPAHRVSWILHFGPIPEGIKVLHECDNPPCVNPSHLFLGTTKDNSDDMIRKGRHKLYGNARVTHNDVRAIRNAYDSGQATKTQLARQYGLGTTTVIYMVNRKTWRNVK